MAPERLQRQLIAFCGSHLSRLWAALRHCDFMTQGVNKETISLPEQQNKISTVLIGSECQKLSARVTPSPRNSWWVECRWSHSSFNLIRQRHRWKNKRGAARSSRHLWTRRGDSLLADPSGLRSAAESRKSPVYKCHTATFIKVCSSSLCFLWSIFPSNDDLRGNKGLLCHAYVPVLPPLKVWQICLVNKLAMSSKNRVFLYRMFTSSCEATHNCRCSEISLWCNCINTFPPLVSCVIKMYFSKSVRRELCLINNTNCLCFIVVVFPIHQSNECIFTMQESTLKSGFTKKKKKKRNC